MSFRGKFEWIKSIHQGGRKAISFTLTCSNMFQRETFDAAIMDSTGQIPPMMFSQEKLAAGKSLRFNIDTVGWDWCQGDTITILDKKGQIDKKNSWTLNLSVPAPGECKECHGTHKCKFCHGTGIISNLRSHEVTSCEKCHGTGICQNCYIPFRNIGNSSNMSSGFGQIYSQQNMPNPNAVKLRKAEGLRQQIRELQMKVEQADWDVKIMKLRGTDITSHHSYMSQVNLKYQYERQLANLQYELKQLENLI